MISSKKILEGCLLAIARDASEKWDLYLDGVETVEEEERRFPKEICNTLDYNQHLLPLYKLSGFLSVNLRAGLSSTAASAKKRELSTVMKDFIGEPKNMSPFSTLVTGEEDWFRSTYDQVQHTSLIIRDKKYLRILSSDIVVGDIIYLGCGDVVAADVRVIVCTKESVIDQSAISSTEHDYKFLQEIPTDTNPMYFIVL